jgi:hypothetical protein
MPPPATHVASLLDLPSTILGRPPRRALLLAPLPPACGPHHEEGEMIQPIPPCPQWFVEFMTGFREGIIAEALAIEAEESGAAVK